MKNSTSASRADLYTRVTDRVVGDLERGVRSWLKRWTSGNVRLSVPRRHNGVPYRGINVLIVWAEAIDELDEGEQVRRERTGREGVPWEP